MVPAWNGLPTSQAGPRVRPFRCRSCSPLQSTWRRHRVQMPGSRGIFSTTVPYRLPNNALVTLFQSLLNFLPLPNGKS